MQRLLGLVRRCADDYHMIEEGDRIAVGISGGKDSLALLVLMANLRRFYPKQFELHAITIDMGLQNMDYTPVAELCERLNVPYTRVETRIGPVVFEERKEKNPCSMCAKMRRGLLNETLLSLGCSKLALGHHYDDAVETFFMSLLYEGRISCFQPVTLMDRAGVTQIRPMLYISENSIEHFSEREQLPVVPNTCPADKNTKRQEIKDLIGSLSVQYPDLRAKLFGAMQRQPLPGWKPEGSFRRPLPDVKE